MENKAGNINKLSLAGVIVTLGVVYGDIGTSPLYVLRAIIGVAGGISESLILGSLSCIFWTLTLQTTIKYILIALQADNKGAGGIFALYALIRKKAKWAFVFAIIGGATLVAEGMITPAISVSSAVEGLRLVGPGIPILPIVIAIICGLFFIQHYGTDKIGKSFGPIMILWFSMLAILGVSQIVHLPEVLKAINPYYAYQLLAEYPAGILLLGAIFLCTTGADALYSDLAHCGKKNIRMSWTFVKISLLLNYFGQGAWLLMNPTIDVYASSPFFAIMPDWWLLPGIIIATVATVIASQAMISGSFSIVNEAISLNFIPKLKIKYPTEVKGQLYIPAVNLFLWAGCLLVILIFRESARIEAAYGLAINLTMLMSTLLLTIYFFRRRVPIFLTVPFLLIYLTIESSFLYSNLNKFENGGWFALLIAGLIFATMYIWYRGRNLKNRFTEFEKIENHVEVFRDLKNDTSIPKYATNLVYLSRLNSRTLLETKIISSIFNKQPKRADLYWLIHIDVLDSPHTKEYTVTTLIPGILIKVDFRLGFQVQPRINLFFREVLDEMIRNKEIDPLTNYPSLRKHEIPADFRFIIIDRIQNWDFDFPVMDQAIMDAYMIVKKIGINEVRAFGLDTSNVVVEKVALQYSAKKHSGLTRRKLDCT